MSQFEAGMIAPPRELPMALEHEQTEEVKLRCQTFANAGTSCRRIAQRMLAFALSAMMCSLGGGVGLGCGGEEPSARSGRSNQKKRRGRNSGGKNTSKKGKGAKGIGVYKKVPDVMRHKFTEIDFRVDVGGDENRDPFRSYVVRGGWSQSPDESARMDGEVCKRENSIATQFALRDLRLRGIVLRGTRSYALFVDSRQLGHIARRGDCLGKDQARVESIGAGFVRLTVTPEAPPGAPAPAPQTRDISLHPDEVALDPESDFYGLP